MEFIISIQKAVGEAGEYATYELGSVVCALILTQNEILAQPGRRGGGRLSVTGSLRRTQL